MYGMICGVFIINGVGELNIREGMMTLNLGFRVQTVYANVWCGLGFSGFHGSRLMKVLRVQVGIRRTLALFRNSSCH